MISDYCNFLTEKSETSLKCVKKITNTVHLLKTSLTSIACTTLFTY